MKSVQQNWKVIYTASRQEKKVADMLTKFGIEHYLPRVKKLRLWSDRKKWVEMPLFNGYVFVRPSENLRDKVLEIPGAVKYLRYNGSDAIVLEREIALLQNLIEKGYELENTSETYSKGDKVRINHGPLKGIEAEVMSTAAGDNYVLISFDTLSQTIKVNLPAGLLNKMKKTHLSV